jgi:hypothetical protein
MGLNHPAQGGSDRNGHGSETGPDLQIYARTSISRILPTDPFWILQSGGSRFKSARRLCGSKGDRRPGDCAGRSGLTEHVVVAVMADDCRQLVNNC